MPPVEHFPQTLDERARRLIEWYELVGLGAVRAGNRADYGFALNELRAIGRTRELDDIRRFSAGIVAAVIQEAWLRLGREVVGQRQAVPPAYRRRA